ncbi:ATP-binding protein [Kitasatospora sp. NPDC051853]|uniref:ATP-binding protein n=1 Tax=Kitasatospora sp. NPDC051853 TaxID=3364058 RepID=UPI0037A4D481
MPAITLRAPVKLDSVGQLRKELPAALVPLQVELTDDEIFAAKVCLTELVANTITHGFQGEAGNESAELTVSVAVDRESGRLRLTAFDPGRGLPVERISGLDEVSGRGLVLIRTYAADFGWGPAPDQAGQQVWCELVIESLNGQATATSAEEQPEQRQDIGLQIAVLGAASAARSSRPQIRVCSVRGRPRAVTGTDTAA